MSELSSAKKTVLKLISNTGYLIKLHDLTLPSYSPIMSNVWNLLLLLLKQMRTNGLSFKVNKWLSNSQFVRVKTSKMLAWPTLKAGVICKPTFFWKQDWDQTTMHPGKNRTRKWTRKRTRTWTRMRKRKKGRRHL